MASKIDEAEELVQKAQKCLKTFCLKRSPDIDSALEYYGRAAVIYRNARMLQESADIYMQIADLHGKKQSFFHCAKAYETASLLFRDIGNFDKVVECIKTAGQLLRQSGVPDSASILYSKGAKVLEGSMPEESARFYECAADTSELEEKYLQAADFAGQSARLWTRLRRFNEADRLLRYQMRLTSLGASRENVYTTYQACGKAVVALVILKLVQEDSVAAGKVYEEAVRQYHFDETDDAAAVAKLLQACEPYDSNAVAKVITLPTFRNLETEFARLARSIKSCEGFGDRALSAAPANEDESEDIC
uniref:Gamma-soluble NSF attachment protein n=1 Tax=Echinococcus granulosus TaxID=6210 RepID=A0A068X155_ECHGR|nr:Gamma soluble NSF attachment protein [Echinococcus granulosus]